MKKMRKELIMDNNLNKIIKEISKQEIKINNLDFKEITLETVFLSLTGKKLRD